MNLRFSVSYTSMRGRSQYRILIPREEGASIVSLCHERKEQVSYPYTMRGRRKSHILISWEEGASLISLYHERKEQVSYPYTRRGRSQYRILIPGEEGASLISLYQERKEPVSYSYTMWIGLVNWDWWTDTKNHFHAFSNETRLWSCVAAFSLATLMYWSY